MSNILNFNSFNSFTQQQTNLYAVVPNVVILYSCKLNHVILPVYLYSWVHQQVHNNNIVDTNVALIKETFAPGNKTGISVSIKDVLKLLGTDVPDDEATGTKGFSQCISYRQKLDNIKPDTRLQYYFLDRDSSNLSGYTIITHDEYNTIIDYVDNFNYGDNPDVDTRVSPSKSKALNCMDMMNIYCYLKMRIQQFQGLAKARQDASFQMKESVEKISSNLSLGSKTISKYLPHFVNMGLISINNGKGLQRNKPNIYTLFDPTK